MDNRVEYLKSKLVSKAVRNVRRGLETDEAARGMYCPEVSLFCRFEQRATGFDYSKSRTEFPIVFAPFSLNKKGKRII